jgi:homoserine kinase
LNNLSKEDPRALLASFTTKLGAGQPVPPQDYVNDLEPPAFSCIPRLKEIKDALLAKGFTCVMMSGSGTSIFAMGPVPPQGFDPAAFAREMEVDVWATRFTGRPEGDSKAWYPNPSSYA